MFHRKLTSLLSQKTLGLRSSLSLRQRSYGSPSHSQVNEPGGYLFGQPVGGLGIKSYVLKTHSHNGIRLELNESGTGGSPFTTLVSMEERSFFSWPSSTLQRKGGSDAYACNKI